MKKAYFLFNLLFIIISSGIFGQAIDRLFFLVDAGTFGEVQSKIESIENINSRLERNG